MILERRNNDSVFLLGQFAPKKGRVMKILKIVLLALCMMLPMPILAEEDKDELEFTADLYEGSLIVINDKNGNEWQRVVVNDNLTVDIQYPVYDGWEFDCWKEEWTDDGVLVLTPVYRIAPAPTPNYVEEAPLPTEEVIATPTIMIEAETEEAKDESNNQQNEDINMSTDEDESKHIKSFTPLIIGGSTVIVVGALGIYFALTLKRK